MQKSLKKNDKNLIQITSDRFFPFENRNQGKRQS